MNLSSFCILPTIGDMSKSHNYILINTLTPPHHSKTLVGQGLRGDFQSYSNKHCLTKSCSTLSKSQIVNSQNIHLQNVDTNSNFIKPLLLLIYMFETYMNNIQTNLAKRLHITNIKKLNNKEEIRL